MERSKEQIFNKKWKRIEDAIQLKTPDRVPILVDFGYLAAKYTGMTKEEAIHNCDKWMAANKKIITDFDPDIFQCNPFISGEVYKALGTRLMKWPGHGVGPNQSHQFVEGEYMKEDEYDAFIQNPLEFMIGTYFPRTCEAFSSLSELPDVVDLVNAARGNVNPVLVQMQRVFASPALDWAAKESDQWTQKWIGFVREMEDLGFPTITSGKSLQTPFDYISDYMRGMRGAMLDMYRQPDKLQEAMQKILPVMIKRARSLANQGTRTLVFTAPHRGSEGFMSKKQFETFYWPGLKAIIETLVEVGVTPYMFWEGDCTSRLEYLLELPEGKVVNRFDRTDLFKAKEILGGHQCIAGGLLPSLLQAGTVKEVQDYCKKLIDIVGKEGGYIMSHSVVLDEAKPENVKAMIDFTKDYGVYR